jgi:hypothetical protein
MDYDDRSEEVEAGFAARATIRYRHRSREAQIVLSPPMRGAVFVRPRPNRPPTFSVVAGEL